LLFPKARDVPRIVFRFPYSRRLVDSLIRRPREWGQYSLLSPPALQTTSTNLPKDTRSTPGCPSEVTSIALPSWLLSFPPPPLRALLVQSTRNCRCNLPVVFILFDWSVDGWVFPNSALPPSTSHPVPYFLQEQRIRDPYHITCLSEAAQYAYPPAFQDADPVVAQRLYPGFPYLLVIVFGI